MPVLTAANDVGVVGRFLDRTAVDDSWCDDDECSAARGVPNEKEWCELLCALLRLNAALLDVDIPPPRSEFCALGRGCVKRGSRSASVRSRLSLLGIAPPAESVSPPSAPCCAAADGAAAVAVAAPTDERRDVGILSFGRLVFCDSCWFVSSLLPGKSSRPRDATRCLRLSLLSDPRVRRSLNGNERGGSFRRVRMWRERRVGEAAENGRRGALRFPVQNLGTNAREP